MFDKFPRLAAPRTRQGGRLAHRPLTLEGLEDRRLLAGLTGAGAQIFHHGISQLPNGSVAAIAGARENVDRFASNFATADFNGDGFEDVAVGAPHESIAGIADVGAINVIYGSASGLTGGDGNTRNEVWYQGNAGVPGQLEAGDLFGGALASSDFNEDGYADLVIGVVGENSVQFLMGSSAGLTPTGGTVIDESVVPNLFDTDSGFGAALAVGSFNSACNEQLVVGMPFHDVNGVDNAGSVAVICFWNGTVDVRTVSLWNQDRSGVEGESDGQDHFGTSLAVGDFNEDGEQDLAIGVPGETEEGLLPEFRTGAVNVLYGIPQGLSSLNNQFWWQNSTNVPGSNESFDHYGQSLAAGDFNRDGADDLAIGVPGENDGAGWVHILRGGDTIGLYTPPSTFLQDLDQSTPGIAGGPEAGDDFGRSLLAADFNGDGFEDLAVGVPGEVFRGTGDGVFHIVYGSVFWGLDTTDPLPGAEPEFHSVDGLNGLSVLNNLSYGWSLAAGDFDADGYVDVMAGMPGFSGGRAYALYSSSSGVTTNAHQYWDQNVPATTSTLQNNAAFGQQLATGDFNGDGRDDLAIGAPGRDLPYEQRWGKEGAGVVNVLYGDDAGTFTDQRAPQILHQDLLDSEAPTYPHGAELFEGFGSALAVGDFNDDGYDDLVVGSPYESTVAIDNGAIHIVFGAPEGLDPNKSVMVYQGTLGLAGTAEAGDQFGKALASADFNNDGVDDIAVGIPNEDNASFSGTPRMDAGTVQVLFGSPITSEGQVNENFFDEIIENRSENELFGWSLAAGSGYLAVGSPGYAGERGKATLWRYFHGQGLSQIQTLSAASSDAGAQFGYSLALGDFDSTFGVELAIGAPFMDLDHADGSTRVDAGSVTVVPVGSGPGEVWHEGLGLGSWTETQGTASSGARFGFALSVGNFNGDNFDDLAIGTPGKAVFAQQLALGAGILHTLYGTGAGLTTSGEQVWNQSSPGLGESIGSEEHFGTALTSGDFNGDGSDDLAVGVPDENMSGFIKSGLVHTILGSAVPTLEPGDFDGDGQLTIADIDQLSSAAARGDHDPAFDLTGDGLVDADDIQHWVVELKGTLLGDANLDGNVDRTDFDTWNGNKFQALDAWSRGNFNGDQYVDGRDLLIWNANKFQAPPPIVTSGVDSRDTLDESAELVANAGAVNTAAPAVPVVYAVRRPADTAADAFDRENRPSTDAFFQLWGAEPEPLKTLFASP